MKRATVYCNKFVFGNRISIHALVKRATFTTVKVAVYCVISIHALVKRATVKYDS